MIDWTRIVVSLRDTKMDAATAESLTSAFRPLAASALRRYGWGRQLHLGVDDVAQDMMIAAWRVVDTCCGDEDTVAAAVKSATRDAARDSVRRAAGWPDRRRTALPTLVDIESGIDPGLSPQPAWDAAIDIAATLRTMRPDIAAATISVFAGDSISSVVAATRPASEWRFRGQINHALDQVIAAATA